MPKLLVSFLVPWRGSGNRDRDSHWALRVKKRKAVYADMIAHVEADRGMFGETGEWAGVTQGILPMPRRVVVTLGLTPRGIEPEDENYRWGAKLYVDALKPEKVERMKNRKWRVDHGLNLVHDDDRQWCQREYGFARDGSVPRGMLRIEVYET